MVVSAIRANHVIAPSLLFKKLLAGCVVLEVSYQGNQVIKFLQSNHNHVPFIITLAKVQILFGQTK